jgi:hypothetical protein
VKHSEGYKAPQSAGRAMSRKAGGGDAHPRAVTCGFPLVVEEEAEQDQEVEGSNGDGPEIRRYNPRRGLLLCGLETER